MIVKLSGFLPVSKEDIESLENALNRKLPAEYINFLLSYNGAKAATNIFSVSENNDCGVDRFIPCKDIVKELKRIDHVSKNMIPVAWAEGGNYILQNLSNGKIFFWDHEIPEKQIELALDITDFIEKLKPFDVNSIELKDGQVQSAWIDPDFLKSLS
ncbi:SMI1/KNR4 family protein [bacterium]|nr:SMI1/KNR4 family protein [bacterium]MBU1883359.1 SMI1/KNR4 family protein [bacterium]